MWHGYAVTSSTLLADPPSNETIDVFYTKKGEEGVATVYLLSGNTVVKDSGVLSRRG